MPEVNVEISGRKYRMACEEGQEPHLIALADRFNRQIEGFKADFGEIGDQRLTVMAALAVLDELVAAERRIGALEADVAGLRDAGGALSEEAEELELKFARRMNEAARKLEAIAAAIDETAVAG